MQLAVLCSGCLRWSLPGHSTWLAWQQVCLCSTAPLPESLRAAASLLRVMCSMRQKCPLPSSNQSPVLSVVPTFGSSPAEEKLRAVVDLVFGPDAAGGDRATPEAAPTGAHHNGIVKQGDRLRHRF